MEHGPVSFIASMANNVKLPESIPFRNQTWQFKLLHKMMVLFFSSIKGVFSIATFSLDPWCSTSGCPSPSSLELVGTPTSLGASLLHGVSCIQNGHVDGETDDKPVDLRGSRCSINPSCISWCQAKAGNVQNPIINHPRWSTIYPRIQIDGFYLINQLTTLYPSWPYCWKLYIQTCHDPSSNPIHLVWSVLAIHVSKSVVSSPTSTMVAGII